MGMTEFEVHAVELVGDVAVRGREGRLP